MSNAWKDILAEPGALPVLPDTLIALRSRLYELDVEVDWLCDQLQRDPVLADEVLRTINSPIFGVRRVASVAQAVVMLGLRRVRAIILSQSLHRSLLSYQSPGFSLYEWWDRSLLTAVGTAMLCRRMAPDLSEEGYLAGLSADLGVLVLARFEPDYRQLLARCRGLSGKTLRDGERELGLPDHAHVGAAALGGWQIPEPVIRSALRHHQPEVMTATEDTLLPRAVYFASKLTDSIITGDPAICDEVMQLANERLFMSNGEVHEFASVCLDRFGELACQFGHATEISRQRLPKGLETAD